MQRLFILLLAAVVVAAVAEPACAQLFGRFPDFPGVTPTTVTRFPLGPGFYLNWIKILLAWLVFLFWVRGVDWMSQDGFALKINYKRWNLIAFFSFLLAQVLLWLLPWFWLGMPLLLIAWIVPFVAYVKHRNQIAPPEETVFTAEHLRWWMAGRLSLIGIKMSAQKRGKDEAPPVEFQPRGAVDDRTNAANLLLSRQSPGFAMLQHLIADLIVRRADAALLDFTQAAATLRFQIDGVWHDIDSRERESADMLLAVIKTLAGRDANQRVARQDGSFGAEFEKNKYTCRLVSQGTKTGERALLQFQRGKNKIEKLADLEMREKLVEALRAQLSAQAGLIVVSAPPAGGLSTLFTVTVSAMDRFVRSFVGIESSAISEFKVENVPVTYFNPAAGETPLSILPKLVREHPDVFIVPDMVDADSGAMLLEQVEHENRQVVTSVRAKEAAESLLRVMALNVPADKFAATVIMALNQRMIRKLCNKCKEAYAPAPNVLEQLGIPAGRVEAFYRVPQPKPEDEKDDEGPCKKCQGIGYFGRTALYELLIVDDGVRAALTKTPQVAAVRAAARKAGMRTLQEEGIVLVAKGVTSLPELMRVLKE
jgi:type II secretory ATPase GspE/PulE/Tfp pilus assembly ATPase PilB-like protein